MAASMITNYTFLNNVPGWSSTLTSQLGHILEEAETLYGARDKKYTILGIEFRNAGPQTLLRRSNKYLSIQLSIGCLNDFNEGVYQLAHEAIHCLRPAFNEGQNTYLEEGMATYFATKYVRENLNETKEPNPCDAKYLEAYNDFTLFISKNISSLKTILNKDESLRISSITEEMFRGNGINLTKDIFEKLNRKF